ncbi:MAG: translation elongation factor Ts [Armatimonadota bacterium]|nr:translation elongation factor Ts [Armatimonadota bacterium]MDR7519463.1 translation elongation factor Ts [Armatimonadota bacterium]MDR7550267.1 translation elongation factor Ts [Armatimonadota bacterium]
MVSADKVKALRERTGAGVMDCRRALEEVGGDLDAAAEVLRARGLAAAAKRAGRVASEGVVEAYIHVGGRLGALVEVNCETDFVARTDEFKTLARELAMQVAASAPRYVSREEIPPDVLAEQRAAILREAPGASEAEVDRRLALWFAEVVLLDQPYIRDAGRRVAEVVTDAAARTGEHIQVRRFARFRLGE